MLKETSYEVLIVSANEKFNTTISRLIPLSINAYITYAENLNLAGRLLLERHFDIVLINNNKDFIEEIEFSIKLSRSNRGVILFTDSINYDEAYYKTNEFGVCVLSRPIESLLFIQSLRVLVSTLDFCG